MKRAAVSILCVALAASASASVAAAVPSLPSLGKPEVERTFSTHTVNGFTVRSTFRVYRPTHANALPKLPFEGRRSLSCPTVGVEDAVVPVALTVTNASHGVSTGLGVAVVTYVDPSVNISRIKYDVTIDGKATCFATTPENAAQYYQLWNRASMPGAGEHADFFLLIPGYYANPHLNGDRAFLKTLSLYVFLYANGHATGRYAFHNAVPPEEWRVRLADRRR